VKVPGSIVCVGADLRTIEELRAALVEFATRYNEIWLVARHGYRTPAQVRAHRGQSSPPWLPRPRADAGLAPEDARQIGQAATVMLARLDLVEEVTPDCTWEAAKEES
jgi:hypothetical protein